MWVELEGECPKSGQIQNPLFGGEPGGPNQMSTSVGKSLQPVPHLP